MKHNFQVQKSVGCISSLTLFIIIFFLFFSISFFTNFNVNFLHPKPFNPQKKSRGNKKAKVFKVNKTTPNIVLIVADDLGWNDISWHNSKVKSPNLEKLAKTGILLEHHYSQHICTPSRGALLTGL